MTAKFEIFRKDLIKMNLYKEVVLDNTASLEFILDNNANSSNYMMDIHNEGAVVNRYGCFNISEEKNTGFITIRPALVKFSLKIIISHQQPFAENKTLTIYRNGKNEIEHTIDITHCGIIELIADDEKYILEINSKSVRTNPVQSETSVISEIPAMSPQYDTNTVNTESIENSDVHTEISQQKLEAIQAESEKDYESYSEKLEELKANYEFDKSIIEYYKDHDLVPIEQIFAELDEKIAAAEKQIILFIQAKENKTKEIQS